MVQGLGLFLGAPLPFDQVAPQPAVKTVQEQLAPLNNRRIGPPFINAHGRFHALVF
jgi:hypothetical protein